MADDGSTAVSLPEVPLLAVLPGTGGLTRLVDKRHVRRDRADFFCTLEEGIKGQRAVEWGLVDEVVPRSRLAEAARAPRGRAARRGATGPRGARASRSTPLERTIEGDRIAYRHVTCAIDRAPGRGRDHRGGAATPPRRPTWPGIHAQGAAFWPLALARELDDLILHLRANEEEIGLWVLRTTGSADLVEAYDRLAGRARRPTGSCARSGSIWKRTLKRSTCRRARIFALVEPGSCFAGTLLELALAADRSYMLDGAREGDDRPAGDGAADGS